MLVTDKQIVDRADRYLSETLHEPVRLTADPETSSWPIYLSQTYRPFTARIAGVPCLFLLTEMLEATPAQLAKHLDAVREFSDRLPIVLVPAISAHMRSRLIGQRVSFVVPGNQLYIPEIAMDLRERFRAGQHAGDKLSPAAQAVLIHHLLRRDPSSTNPKALSRQLGYSAMSIGRAFDDLEAARLAVSERKGRHRDLRFPIEPRELFEAATPLLRSPVRSQRYYFADDVTYWDPDVLNLQLAGESALAERTDLLAPILRSYAGTGSEVRSAVRDRPIRECEQSVATISIESWVYDPRSLSDGYSVDPLSLFAAFRNHPNERISAATEQLLTDVTW